MVTVGGVPAARVMVRSSPPLARASPRQRRAPPNESFAAVDWCSLKATISGSRFSVDTALSALTSCARTTRRDLPPARAVDRAARAAWGEEEEGGDAAVPPEFLPATVKRQLASHARCSATRTSNYSGKFGIEGAPT